MGYTKDINLLPEKPGFAGKYTQTVQWIAAAAAVLLIIITAAWALPSYRLSALKNENTKITVAINTLKAGEDIASILNEKKQKLDVLKQTHEAILSEKVDVLGLLTKISKVLPMNVYVSSMTISNGTTISANFISHDPVDTIRLVVNLKQTNLFENVDLASVSIKPADQYIIPLTLTLKNGPGNSSANTSNSIGNIQNSNGTVKTNQSNTQN